MRVRTQRQERSLSIHVASRSKGKSRYIRAKERVGRSTTESESETKACGEKKTVP